MKFKEVNLFGQTTLHESNPGLYNSKVKFFYCGTVPERIFMTLARNYSMNKNTQ